MISKMKIDLIMPCEKYWESYKASYNETDHEGLVDGMDWDGESAPEVYFQRAQELSEGKNLNGLVPATNFWIIADAEYVGRMSIRHELNEHLEIYGGHIGYEIKTSARQRGIATKALSLALEYCKQELSLSELLLTCDDNNIASIKTIERNNGVLRDKRKDEGNNRLSRYYKINL